MHKITLLAAISLCSGLSAQTQPETTIRMDVVSKSAKAINYERGTGATRIDFSASSLMPGATGGASVESKRGYIQVSAKFEKLESPQKFGAEYLTYVMWSISPEGRVENLGEILIKDGKGKLNVTTELQIFGLFVTAEPYFAVRTPSDVIVLENELRKDTRGKVYLIDSKLELLQRGQYAKLSNPLNLAPDLKAAPLELYEARNALLVAKSFLADKYAADTFGRADASVKMAERLPNQPDYIDEVVRTSRQAVQIAEDARAISVERQVQEKLAKERAESERQKQEAQRKAAEETARRHEAEQARELATAQKTAADQARMLAEVQAARASQQKAEADLERRKAEESAKTSQEAAKTAEEARLKAEAERKALRERLLAQFSAALPTKDTERGLVVNMGDVLFDTGKFDLRPPAREKLARLAGICLAYPGLRLRAEGYTDSTGSDDLNQKLSDQRAAAVKNFLNSQGLPESVLSSQGFGKDNPVASNDSAQGRQQNRRVELVVSGDVIGTAIGKN
ncbi:MAG: OmpA family protein [Acidobacteria bacterium]|nr:OmpA family protein [Acidobacteriota bacterium]